MTTPPPFIFPRFFFPLSLSPPPLFLLRAPCAPQGFPNTSGEGRLYRPFSVIIPAIYAWGVTSKAGFRTLIPSGAIRCSRQWVTSRGSRSSMGGTASSTHRSGDRWWSRGRPHRRGSVRPGQDRHRVGSDFIGRVPVGGDAGPPPRSPDRSIPFFIKWPAMLSVISVR